MNISWIIIFLCGAGSKLWVLDRYCAIISCFMISTRSVLHKHSGYSSKKVMLIAVWEHSDPHPRTLQVLRSEYREHRRLVPASTLSDCFPPGGFLFHFIFLQKYTSNCGILDSTVTWVGTPSSRTRPLPADTFIQRGLRLIRQSRGTIPPWSNVGLRALLKGPAAVQILSWPHRGSDRRPRGFQSCNLKYWLAKYWLALNVPF